MTRDDQMAAVRSELEVWLDKEAGAGRTEYTVGDLKRAADELLAGYRTYTMRALYDISRSYVQIVGAQVGRRTRRNFAEQVFTPAQVRDMVMGIVTQHLTTLSYAEVFAAMRDQQSGKVAPEPAPADPVLSELRALREEVAALKEGSVVPDVLTQGALPELLSEVRALRAESAEVRAGIAQLSQSGVGPDGLAQGASPELLAEVRALRGEIAQLRQSGVAPDGLAQGEVSALLAEVRAVILDSRRGSTLSGDELWRLAMVMMNLSVHEGAPRLPEMMNYLGVRDSAAELERARQFGMDEVLSG